ncbi:MAG: cyclophilin-like fold protein [Betaproteobacteria bacterium]
MKLRLIIDGKVVAATLSDNATAKDFLSLLPMTVTLEDYAATEKIAYLSRKLSTVGAPSGSDPSVGSIAYYAPWGNVALFYKDAPYARGLVPLGRIDAGIEVLRAAGPLKARIEAAN